MIGFITFYASIFLLLISYFIDPYKINEGKDIVIDGDTVGLLKMIYIIAVILSGIALFSFLSAKMKTYIILSVLILMVSLFFLAKMFIYFDRFLD